MGSIDTFRGWALRRLTEEFGEPKVLKVERDALYRWVLHRAHGLSVYLTLDSPELPDMAHLLISDPSSQAIEPIASRSMRTKEELEAVIKLIHRQWNGTAER
ncbi:MAG TPA: hypothetical protein VD963_10930 [Phycisphaerales bacterium]|nr:hypothetical protein [Phycisphaerales bacterium]